MCLRPASPLPVPDDTAHVARLAFPRGNLLLSLRDRLGPVFDDRRFAHLFPAKGQPAEAPWRLALVTLLQFAEGLPDRQAGVRHGSMRQPAAVDATATGDRDDGSETQRQARGGAGMRPER